MDTDKDILSLRILQCDIANGEAETNLERYRQIIADAPPTDLWVLPETFATGFCFPPAPTAARDGEMVLEWLKQTARRYDTAVCGSALAQDNGRMYNRFFLVDARGEIQSYDKRHLFSYGNEGRYIAPGTSRVLWRLHGWKILPIVCYDLRFPVWSRNDCDYDLLLCVANWPDSRIAAWDALLRARAIENMAYVAGANRVGRDMLDSLHTGHSDILTPLGKSLPEGRAPHTEACVLHGELSRQRIRTLRSKYGFLEDRDRFSIEL